jgi:hypothetical protein
MLHYLRYFPPGARGYEMLIKPVTSFWRMLVAKKSQQWLDAKTS